MLRVRLGGVGSTGYGLPADWPEAPPSGAMTISHSPEALVLHDRLFLLHTALFLDASPGPTKYALHKLGVLEHAGVRLPITAASDICCAAVDAALTQAGLTG